MKKIPIHAPAILLAAALAGFACLSAVSIAPGQATLSDANSSAVELDPVIETSVAEAVDDPLGDSSASKVEKADPPEDDPFAGGDKVGAGKPPVDDPFGENVPAGLYPNVIQRHDPVALLEWIETDLVTANQLLANHGAKDDVGELRDALEELIGKKKARLVETSYLRCSSGQRMTTKSILEHIYPTEFDPPEIPQTFSGDAEPPVSSANPTAFDTRNVGTEVQIEMTVGVRANPTPIGVNVSPVITRHLGDISVLTDPRPEQRVLTQPDFSTATAPTSVTVYDGATSLLGLHVSPQDRTKRMFVLMSVDLLKPLDIKMPPAKVDRKSERIGAHFEWIAVDHSEANGLLREHGGTRDAGELRKKLAGLIDAGGAELIESSYLRTSPGQVVRAKSIREHIYPTEWDPPELPQKFSGKGGVRATGANPTAFDTRYVGTFVEMEPNTDASGRLVEMRIAPDITRFLGNRNMGDDLPEEISGVQQPKFYNMSVLTNVSAVVGQHNLVGCFTPPDDPDRRILLLVKADLVN